MSEAANTTLVQGLYAAFGRGEIPSILTALADDVDWTVSGPTAGGARPCASPAAAP